MDVPVCRKSCGKPAVERILEFGKELHSMNQRLKLEQNFSENNEKMLTVCAVYLFWWPFDVLVFMFQDAFSLLAYSNPWASPVGWQLDPAQRETVCASLNSAILGES